MGEEAAPTPGSPGSSSAIKRVRTVDECQDMIQRSLRTPMVIFLREQMEKAGCGVSDKFFKAVYCQMQMSGCYNRNKGIMVCSNHMNFQDDVNQVIIHELIHAYDECRAANLNWTNCAHQACSEIRAGHLSGDCNFKRELLRGYMKIKGHEQMKGLGNANSVFQL
ncbi:mitochondrial inner membrane protease ATP23 homolog isoform X2 [Tripterygium wilfordii]|uniref:mitochondrial inner membrane protease ATP23 homolog isoform X2 n=1 Tax=Tripterygium wilfordii TaxID=458696 RepID=UPI0018F8039B|nr:mitochondrial inner membrane protease ATP23 homolog isoform X2 [Tripterygium wilfordii]